MKFASLDNNIIFERLFSERDILSAFVTDITGLVFEPSEIRFQDSIVTRSDNADSFALDCTANDLGQSRIIGIMRFFHISESDFLSYFHAMIKSCHERTDMNKPTVCLIGILTSRKSTGLGLSLISSVANEGKSSHCLLRINPHHPDSCSDGSGLDDDPSADSQAYKGWLELFRQSLIGGDISRMNGNRSIIEKAAKLLDYEGFTENERNEFREQHGYETIQRLRGDRK
ncbi:MAG: hypothetical protein B6244_12110 [Candidatus Cloacimonetes bacterium 4572_55]|nr:MAG: hypothetical protein B6244_12110 [Candidatus Cloacimonetes bacterium 4572_55]